MRSQAAGRGKISPRCVPVLPAVARHRPDAFPKGPRTGKTPVRGNISPACIQIQLILARYAWHASKNPAKRRWGIHRANILPPRGAFAVRSPQIMHGARILPPSGGPAPAQGLLPEQPHRGIAFQRLDPCPGGAYPPSTSPIPATRCTPPALQTQPNTSSWARWLLPKKRNGARQRIKAWKRQLGFRYKQRLAFEGCVMPSTRRIG